MLHVYHSNRLEALFILLCSLRESRPPADPLIPETVLVANPGIGRWLNFKIADRAGIAANIDYVLPATFVWQLYRSCLENVPEKSAFERNALRLRVLGQLDEINRASDEIWSPLQRYTVAEESHADFRAGSEVNDTKRVQLATRIADVFDQYLVYRPQMLLDWERGSNNTPGNDPAQRWQPELWRRLVRSVDEPHRAALWREFCARADSGKIDPALIPSQLHLFNVGLLPPSTLDVLVRLAKVGDTSSERVSMYFLNPAIDYWADLLDLRRTARERLKLKSADPQANDEIGNTLLSSLGGSGRTLMKLLSERSEWVHDEQFFLPSASDNLLSAVQADLLHPYESSIRHGPVFTESGQGELNFGDTVAGAEDETIQLHQCYNPMREIQALHDRLLDRFNADHTLTPADVIVMVPDINRYAPVIEAVFGSVGNDPDKPDQNRYIPWSIADRALVQVSRIVDCVQRLFELPGFEFEATGVLGFAAEPAIARRYGFDDNGLRTISEWLQESGVRRTFAGGHSTILNQSAAAPHSWDFGLRRLLLGRAMPAGSGAVGNTLPSTLIEGHQAELLSQLLDLLTDLKDTCAKLTEPRSPSDWVDLINDMISRFLSPDEAETNALSQLREMLIEIETDATSARHTDVMSHATFAEILRGALAGAQRKNHRYLTGRVTFSSLVPLRSVPFRIVCMLGLNDSDFPRQRPNFGFDLIAKKPLPGDRSVRDDDRYLFLEALLSARDELYLSWIYRDSSDNSPREPSVLVSELRDYLNKRHPDQPARCVSHPLQPFSPRLFNRQDPSLHTFADEWAPPETTPAVVTLNDTGIAREPEAQISVDDFLQFWRNPSGWYCRRVLGIALWREEQEPQDAEPFDINALENYQLGTELTAVLLHNPTFEKAQANAYLQQIGALPHGGLGEIAFETVFNEAVTMVDKIRSYELSAIPVLDIDITVGEQQLQGRLRQAFNFSNNVVGLVHHHNSALKGSHLCALWLSHLIGSAAGVLTGASLLLTRDKDRAIKERAIAAVDQQEALLKLQPWFDGFNQGQQRALPFFPKTSAAMAGAVSGKAESVWLPSGSTRTGPAESEEETVQLLYTNVNEILEREDVLDWAHRLLGDEGLKV